MKVHVVCVEISCGPYESDDHEILGVFKTAEAANEAIRKDILAHWDEGLNPEGLDGCLANRSAHCFECETRNFKIKELEMED